MNVQIEESWQQRLQDEFDKPYFEKNFILILSPFPDSAMSVSAVRSGRR